MLTNTRNISFKYYLCLKMELSDATPVSHHSPYPLKLPISLKTSAFYSMCHEMATVSPYCSSQTVSGGRWEGKKKCINKQITKIKVNNKWIWEKGTVGSGYLKFTTPPDAFSSIPTPGVWEKEKKKEKEGLPSFSTCRISDISIVHSGKSGTVWGLNLSSTPRFPHFSTRFPHWDLLAKVEQKNCKRTGKA